MPDCRERLESESGRWLKDALLLLIREGARLDFNAIAIEEIEGIRTTYLLRKLLVERILRERVDQLATIPVLKLDGCQLAWDPLGLRFAQETSSVFMEAEGRVGMRAPYFLMLDFLRQYLVVAGVLEFRAEAFASVLEQFEAYCFDYQNLPVEAKTFIVNCDIGTQTVDLADGIAIRASTNVERAFFQEMGAEWGLPSIFAVPMSVVAISEMAGNRSGQLVYNELLPRAQGMRRAVVQALLILRAKGAYEGPDLVGSSNPFLIREPRWSYPMEMKGQITQTADLTNEEFENVVNLVEKLQSSTLDAKVALALRRLGDAAGRSLDADRLIDYWVGLEALSGGKDQELKYRVTFRTARFIGNEQAERIAIRRAAEKSYVLRSSIVHGGGVGKTSEQQLRATTNETGFWLREAVRQCILNNATAPNLEDLDALALA